MLASRIITSVTSSLDFPTIELKLFRCKLCSFGRQQKVVLDFWSLAVAPVAHLADLGRETEPGKAVGPPDGLARAEKGGAPVFSLQAGLTSQVPAGVSAAVPAGVPEVPLFTGDAQCKSVESKWRGATCGSIGLTALGLCTGSAGDGDGAGKASGAGSELLAFRAFRASCKRSGSLSLVPWRFAKTSASWRETRPDGHQLGPISACLPMLLCLIMTSVTSIF